MGAIAQPTQFNLAYYENLLTSQYQDAQNTIAWLDANLQLFQDVFVCLNNFGAAYDLGQAVGTQLDDLGGIIGASRTVSFQPSNGVSPVLDDTTYRLLLQATVAKNHWGGLTSELRSIWNGLFPGGVLLINDNQNMTVNIYVAAPLTSIIQDLIVNGLILPRPQGVLYIIKLAVLPILGFDQNNSYVAGTASAGTTYGMVNTSGTGVTRVAASTTGTAAASSYTVVVASATGIAYGQAVSGTHIASGSYVTNVSGTTITLSLETTGSLSSTALTFTYPGNAFVSGDASGTILISGVSYTVASYTDASHITLSSSAGTQTGVFYFIGTGGHFPN